MGEEQTDGSPSRHSGIVRQQTPRSTPRTPRRKRMVDLIAPDPDCRPASKKERVLSSATRIYIIRDKLKEEEVDELRRKVGELGGMNASLAFANLILTKLRAEKRILRQVDRDVQSRRVPILDVSWLHDSAKEKLLQPYDKYRLVTYAGQESQVGASTGRQDVQHPFEANEVEDGATEEEDGAGSEKSGFGSREASREVEENRQEGAPSVGGVIHNQGPLWQNVEYACLRPSPLRSWFNQALVDELEVLRLQRVQSGGQEVNATAYGRAISAVKALPFALATNPSKARQIKGIGPKIAKLIAQFYEQGHIAEAETIRRDHAFQTMTDFMELYGVGPKRAREYYSQGARSLDDVIRTGGSLGTHLHIQECLRILPDLRCKIPRTEVVEIARLIQAELDHIRPGCLSTICGGFRRGKLESNDVDVVITDPNPASAHGQITCMEELLRQLKKRALITHVINVTTPSSTYEPVFSHIDVAEVVVLPPLSSTISVSRHRRVDIILCPHQTYGAAILGWTGSRQFERDLRLLAKHRGFKFHSTGLVYQHESRPLATTREEDIFELLRIPYMPPHLRNCDA